VVQGATVVRLKRKIGKDALAAVGRGAGEELGVPMADNGARFNQRRGGAEADQDNHGREDRNRRGGVHGDAQRTMVGIAIERMHVRHLDHGQQRQQGQTEKCGCAESSWLPAAAPAEISLERCQSTIPNFKDTQN